MSALTRERLIRLLYIASISALIGVAYSVRINAPAPTFAAALAGAVSAALIAGSIGGIEIFALRAGRRPWISNLPFLVVVVVKTLVYAAITTAVLILGPVERLAGIGTAYQAHLLWRIVGFSLLVTSIFVILLQAARLVGYRTFRDLLLGKYRRPRLERRFFLFVDVVGSTALAERVGPLAAHRYLAAVFDAVAEPIAARHGEIYQYVGDEIVVTWPEAEGAREARPLRCFFDMRAAVGARACEFGARFGMVPEFRAALHFDEVIAGEIGLQRRAIVFHGDVMNVTSRLEQATREIDCAFIASESAVASAGGLDDFECRDLGALALRGRADTLRAFCIAGLRRGA
jgi:adenylate cyclase